MFPFLIMIPKYILILIFCCCTVNAVFKLQVLHTNDMHSRFEEADIHGGPCLPNTTPCFGGFARVKKAVDDAKKEAKLAGYQSVFLDAGDVFQGTPYYTLFKWKIVASLIETLKLDAMTLGNHEFDDGIDDVVHYLNNISTPVVACNLNLTSEERLKVPTLRSSLTLTLDNTKIGIIGYLTPDTMAISHVENLKIFNEIPYIRAEAQRLKKEGVNIIIALGHSGFDRDKEIAYAIPEISLIVGGHSHSFLYTPKDKPPSIEHAEETYPYIVTQKSGKKIPVVTAFCHAKYLGKLIVTFNDTGEVISAEGNPILLDSTIKKDPETQKVVAKWSNEITEELHMVKGKTRVFLGNQNYTINQYESNLANLITDAFIHYSVKHSERTGQNWTAATIAILNFGGFRIEIDPEKNNGMITKGDILTLLPFETKLNLVQYKGSTIKAALEHGVTEQKQSLQFPYFMFASGLKVIYNFSNPCGHRVKSVMVLCRSCSIPHYLPLNNDYVYNVILSTFLLEGGDKFDMFKNEKLNVTALNITDTDAFTSYLEDVKIVYPALDGRIVNENFPDFSSSGFTSTISVHMFLVVSIGCIYTTSLM